MLFVLLVVVVVVVAAVAVVVVVVVASLVVSLLSSLLVSLLSLLMLDLSITRARRASWGLRADAAAALYYIILYHVRLEYVLVYNMYIYTYVLLIIQTTMI